MATQLHWVEGPWPGKLALAAGRRGHDVSLLTADEEREFDLREEPGAAKRQGMEFISFPIPDQHVRDPEERTAAVVERVNAGLESGNKAVIHCRQGMTRRTDGRLPSGNTRYKSEHRGCAAQRGAWSHYS